MPVPVHLGAVVQSHPIHPSRWSEASPAVLPDLPPLTWNWRGPPTSRWIAWPWTRVMRQIKCSHGLARYLHKRWRRNHRLRESATGLSLASLGKKKTRNWEFRCHSARWMKDIPKLHIGLLGAYSTPQCTKKSILPLMTWNLYKWMLLEWMNLPNNSHIPAFFQLRTVPVVVPFRFLGPRSPFTCSLRAFFSLRCGEESPGDPLEFARLAGCGGVSGSEMGIGMVWNRDTRPLNVLKKVGIEARML